MVIACNIPMVDPLPWDDSRCPWATLLLSPRVPPVLWDMTLPFSAMIEDINAGKLGSRPYTIGLADGSVRLLRTEGIPAGVWQEIEQVKARIEKGELQIPYVADAAQVRALMTDVQAPAPQ